MNEKIIKKKITCIEDFEVYQKSLRIFEIFIEEDLPLLNRSFVGKTLAGNQLRCLDSICANMEEGYDRMFGKEVKHFFRISKGSAAEAKGRYKRFKKVLSEKTISSRVNDLGEITAMLASLIRKWK